MGSASTAGGFQNGLFYSYSFARSARGIAWEKWHLLNYAVSLGTTGTRNVSLLLLLSFFKKISSCVLKLVFDVNLNILLLCVAD